MPLMLIIGALAIVAVLVGAYVLSQNGADDTPEVPYIPIDGITETSTTTTTTDVENPVEEEVKETIAEASEAMDEALEQEEALLPRTDEEKKKKSSSIIGQVKRSKSVKSISKAVNSILK